MEIGGVSTEQNNIASSAAVRPRSINLERTDDYQEKMARKLNVVGHICVTPIESNARVNDKQSESDNRKIFGYTPDGHYIDSSSEVTEGRTLAWA